MPTVLRIGSFRFHFYSDEGNEPPHIHVATPDGECKFWLDSIRLARNKGIAPGVMKNRLKTAYFFRKIYPAFMPKHFFINY
jgi:hypothetical protein